METIITATIAAAITLYFVRRHVKNMPAAKPATRPARRKPGATQREAA
jgi:hypothetical protein